MKLTPILLSFIVAIALVGCSKSDDEGGVSTATPADKLDRPPPVDVAGGSAASAGTLPQKR